MNAKLAEIYGNLPEDLEKTAASEMAEGLAEEDSFEGYSMDDLEQMAQAVLSDEDEGEGEEKIASDLEQADLAGRVMAHSFVQETREIEKEAGAISEGAKKAWGAVSGGVRKGSSRYLELMKGGKFPGGKGVQPKLSTRFKGRKGERGKVWAARGGTAAALGAAGVGGAAALGGKKKKSSDSAFDALVEARIAELAEANGLEYNPEVEKTASEPAEVLATAVETAARSFFEENGYQFEE